jgi:hypothetical protein
VLECQVSVRAIVDSGDWPQASENTVREGSCKCCAAASAPLLPQAALLMLSNAPGQQEPTHSLSPFSNRSRAGPLASTVPAPSPFSGTRPDLADHIGLGTQSINSLNSAQRRHSAVHVTSNTPYSTNWAIPYMMQPQPSQRSTVRCLWEDHSVISP